MLKEFREFAIRGNVMDLAVAVIIGGAFGKIVTSLVNDLLMPLIGLVLGGVNFSNLAIVVGGAEIKWGAFVQSIIDFLIIAFVIFLLVRAINRLKREEPIRLRQRNARIVSQRSLSKPLAARIVPLS